MMHDNFKKIFSVEMRTKYFVHILACFLVASVLIFSFLVSSSKPSNNRDSSGTTKVSDSFRDISLEAKSAVVWDIINQRELFLKNPDAPLPLASLTKILTVIIANEKLGDNQKIKITKEDLKPDGDSKLVVGDSWNVKDLRDFTLLTSSNDGAFALAALSEAETNPTPNDLRTLKEQFVGEMNEVASKIGLLNSKFFNENGLDMTIDKGGAYGSAKDMAILFEYALRNYPELLEATRYKNLEFASDAKRYPAENTNIAIDKIPNVIASKTGYTDLAGGNLVIAFDAGLGRPIIISVLGSTEEGRFTDVQKLVEATIKKLPDL